MSSEFEPSGFPGSDAAATTAANWVADEVAARAPFAKASSVPILLSLPESNGAEIAQVVDRGLVRKTESATAVLDDDAGLIVALPKTMGHRSFLQRIIAGYKIVSDSDFGDLLDKAENMPDGDSGSLCRSGFVNFDKLITDLDPAGTVVSFSQISRVCKLHTLKDSEWALSFWSNADDLVGLYAAPAMTAVAVALAEDAEAAAQLHAVVDAFGSLSSKDHGLLSSLVQALLGLGLALRDVGWSLQLGRVGLVNRDGRLPTCCLLLLHMEVGDENESDLEVVERMLVQISSVGALEIKGDGSVAAL